MYENIRKPGLLRGIPLLFIRALPALYYYGKFSGKSVFPRGQKLYQQNLDYLTKAIALMNIQISGSKLSPVQNLLNDIKNISPEKIDDAIEQLTFALSGFCSENPDFCHRFYKENKQQLINLYRESVTPLHILTSDAEPEEKLPHLLCDFCYYDVTRSSRHAEDYPDLLSENDFIVLTDLASSEIHREIERINAFHKPAMVVTMSDATTSENRTAIRHAMQLIRTGFPVIFKILTPIRLFTTIEKTFFKYHMQALSA